MGFIDTLQAEGYAVESICRVLREQGCQIAARTYRAWRAARQPAAWTVSDATVINAISTPASPPILTVGVGSPQRGCMGGGR